MFDEESRSKQDILNESAEAYSLGNSFDYQRFFPADSRQKLEVIHQAEEHVMGLRDGKDRFVREVSLLGQAFALSLPQIPAMKIAEEVAFFQEVKARLVKFEGTGIGKRDAELETTIKRIGDSALSSDKVVDIFEAAGITKPEISILSDEFLLEVKGMKHKNLALELLKKTRTSCGSGRAHINCEGVNLSILEEDRGEDRGHL